MHVHCMQNLEKLNAITQLPVAGALDVEVAVSPEWFRTYNVDLFAFSVDIAAGWRTHYLLEVPSPLCPVEFVLASM